SQITNELQATLKNWINFYNGYDPLFSWWNQEPYKAVDKALEEYANELRENLAGIKPGYENAIVGNPIGREALLAELQYEMVPFTPEQLIATAEKEYAWCEREAKKAAQEMGCGDDWKKAM